VVIVEVLLTDVVFCMHGWQVSTISVQWFKLQLKLV